MLDKNRIATELEHYMSATELEAMLRVLSYVYTQALADVPEPPQGG